MRQRTIEWGSCVAIALIGTMAIPLLDRFTPLSFGAAGLLVTWLALLVGAIIGLVLRRWRRPPGGQYRASEGRQR